MRRSLVIIALAAFPVFADDVYLRGGGQITGEIIEQTADHVTVDIGGATITARTESIVRIEKSVSPLQEYRVRAGEISAGDAEAWRELARWAKGRLLSSQAAEAYAEVIAILPDDVEANEALGHVRLNGEWVTEEESYRARGYVEFEGEWMTPNERQTILAERQARESRKAAERREIDAKIKEIEDEQRAERERQALEREAARSPVSWGWGGGPGYWPQPGYWRWQPVRGHQ